MESLGPDGGAGLYRQGSGGIDELYACELSSGG